MLAQDRPKSHGTTTVFKDYGYGSLARLNLFVAPRNVNMKIRPLEKPDEES